MYGKIFARSFTHSMMGAGSHVFSVMSYVIANTVKSRVELNPKYLATVIGDTEENMRKAIEYLCSPDPASTNPDFDGRRLVKEGPYQYLVPSHEIYRSIGNSDDLREANRNRVAGYRQRQKEGKGGSLSEPTLEPQEYAPTPEQHRFKKPTREELNPAAAKLGLSSADVDRFVNYYESNGWRVGRNPMKSWPHALSNWKSNNVSRGTDPNRPMSEGGDRNPESNRKHLGQYDHLGKA